MRIVNGFVLRKVCGENVISGEGVEQINFNKLLRLNPSAALVFENLMGKEFSLDDAVDILMSNYEGIDRSVAQKDSKNLIDKLIELGIVVE